MDLEIETQASAFDDEPEKFANENGLEIVESRDDELQIDIDCLESDIKVFESQLEILKQFVGVEGIRRTVSRSGNAHIYVKLGQSLSITTRVALQACLGSDRKRELLTLKGIVDGQCRPMFLYEVKAK